MDRNQQSSSTSLLFREGETIAEILQAYQKLVAIATDRITNKVSVGQAAHNDMAMKLETQRLIKGVENLLALTRRIRELWIVGPIRRPDDGGRQLEETIEADVRSVTEILNQLRSNVRQQSVTAGGGYGQYVVGPLSKPPVLGPAAPIAAPQQPISDAAGSNTSSGSQGNGTA
ncbi:hypothetical protein BD289DRAFT_289596 [Coniella lustricola]|uniref:Surfeit locus protein 5 subunit 22 of mediator complex-domain-containing protein n=1 Tax=Coniella lustricola TaxID=2025994 RepID=A0A2T3A597_9PEZI|nr:hypothetical protein BD289DRAFT_289596 [Coniella lustricola]